MLYLFIHFFKQFYLKLYTVIPPELANLIMNRKQQFVKRFIKIKPIFGLRVPEVLQYYIFLIKFIVLSKIIK